MGEGSLSWRTMSFLTSSHQREWNQAPVNEADDIDALGFFFPLLHPPLSSVTDDCHHLQHHHHPSITSPVHQALPFTSLAYCPCDIVTIAMPITHDITTITIYHHHQTTATSPNYQHHHVCHQYDTVITIPVTVIHPSNTAPITITML